MMETTVAGLYVGDGMYLGRESFDALKAGQKRGREMLANALTDIATKHGASVERQHGKRNPWLLRAEHRSSVSCARASAPWSISTIFTAANGCSSIGSTTSHPARNFTSRFGSEVGSGGNGRPHHKATSHPRDWYSLAMMLDGGLLLAARGEAFEANLPQRNDTKMVRRAWERGPSLGLPHGEQVIAGLTGLFSGVQGLPLRTQWQRAGH
jgi:hypothetical protein